VKDQLAAMYRRAHDAGIRVVAGTIIPYNTATTDQNARMRDINDWKRRTTCAECDASSRTARRKAACRAAAAPLALDAYDWLAKRPSRAHEGAPWTLTYWQ
jgi:hypothetical protein